MRMEDIEKVFISDEMRKQADINEKAYIGDRVDSLTALPDKIDAIRLSGYLGEQMVKAWAPCLGEPLYGTHDFLYYGIRIEVKTKSCNTVPKGDYVAQVMADQRNRPVDYYLFTRHLNTFKQGWVLGWMHREEFFDRATLLKAGTQNHNFTLANDRYDLELKDLYAPDSFIERLCIASEDGTL